MQLLGQFCLNWKRWKPPPPKKRTLAHKTKCVQKNGVNGLQARWRRWMWTRPKSFILEINAVIQQQSNEWRNENTNKLGKERASAWTGQKRRKSLSHNTCRQTAKKLCVNWCNISVVSILCVGCWLCVHTLFSFIRSTAAHTHTSIERSRTEPSKAKAESKQCKFD